MTSTVDDIPCFSIVFSTSPTPSRRIKPGSCSSFFASTYFGMLRLSKELMAEALDLCILSRSLDDPEPRHPLTLQSTTWILAS